MKTKAQVVKLKKPYKGQVAFASITLNDEIILHGFKLIVIDDTYHVATPVDYRDFLIYKIKDDLNMQILNQAKELFQLLSRKHYQ